MILSLSKRLYYYFCFCRPLRVRLEQVLVSQHEPVTLYKLTNLLKFYETTIKQLLPNDCQLVLVLDEVSNLSSKMFLNAYVILI